MQLQLLCVFSGDFLGESDVAIQLEEPRQPLADRLPSSLPVRPEPSTMRSLTSVELRTARGATPQPRQSQQQGSALPAPPQQSLTEGELREVGSELCSAVCAHNVMLDHNPFFPSVIRVGG